MKYHGAPRPFSKEVRQLQRTVSRIRDDLLSAAKSTNKGKRRDDLTAISGDIAEMMDEFISLFTTKEFDETGQAKVMTISPSDISILVNVVDSFVFQGYQAGVFVGPEYFGGKGGKGDRNVKWWPHARKLGAEILRAMHLSDQGAPSPGVLAAKVLEKWEVKGAPTLSNLRGHVRRWIKRAPNDWLTPDVAAWAGSYDPKPGRKPARTR